MGEVTLPCFLISLPKAIFVIARLVGPFSGKKCDRDLENAVRALRPRAAFSTLISQFFAIRTDLEPFLSALRYQPTHRGRLRTDRSRTLCFKTNPYNPYIF